MTFLTAIRRSGFSLLGPVLMLLSAGAQAHMPYLLPNVFDLNTRNHVTVIASFTDALFVPDIAMKSDAYAVITPSGERVPITQIQYLKDLAVFEVTTREAGVYRITSGERLGRKSRMWKQPDGNWKFVDEREPAPAEVKVVDVQSVTTADVYVTRGKANRTALEPSGKGVEIRLHTLPHEMVAKQSVKAELLFEGKALADVGVDFYRGALEGINAKPVAAARSDAQGQIAFTLPEPGTYLALIRHRTESPAGAETAWRSYSYTLTFAVVE